MSVNDSSVVWNTRITWIRRFTLNPGVSVSTMNAVMPWRPFVGSVRT